MKYLIPFLAAAFLPITVVSAQSEQSETSPASKLISCELGRPSAASADPMRSAGPTHRFLLLVGPHQSGQRTDQVRFFDPANLLRGSLIQSAIIENNGDALIAENDPTAPVRFKLFVFIRSGDGALARTLEGAPSDQLAVHFVGACSISESADAVARFEELSNSQ